MVSQMDFISGRPLYCLYYFPCFIFYSSIAYVRFPVPQSCHLFIFESSITSYNHVLLGLSSRIPFQYFILRSLSVVSTCVPTIYSRSIFFLNFILPKFLPILFFTISSAQAKRFTVKTLEYVKLKSVPTNGHFNLKLSSLTLQCFHAIFPIVFFSF